MGWIGVMVGGEMLFLKKGGEGGAGGQAVGKARRMCHRAGKVQGYRRQHCSRIREWRSQAKLCCEPTMCVREGERKRVRAGGGARAPPPARFAPGLTRRAWTPLPVPLATAHGKDRKDLLKKIPNDRSRLAANSSFLSWALFPLPLSLSFLEKLAS